MSKFDQKNNETNTQIICVLFDHCSSLIRDFIGACLLLRHAKKK